MGTDISSFNSSKTCTVAGFGFAVTGSSSRRRPYEGLSATPSHAESTLITLHDNTPVATHLLHNGLALLLFVGVAQDIVNRVPHDFLQQQQAGGERETDRTQNAPINAANGACTTVVTAHLRRLHTLCFNAE